MGIELSSDSWQVLLAFAVYLVGVAALGIVSHRYLSRGSFVKGYFLGNRGLGPWVLALTVAATAISGGSFMGFPSLVYSNGWIMGLWIASYMVVPLMSMALMGKRINQVARMSGAVTMPDVLRDRFQSPALGIIASLLILLFLVFNLIAQFKAGGLVMKEALRIRPTPATFQEAKVDRPHKLLELSFLLPDGTREVQRTPLPHVNAEYLADQTEVLADEREVIVHFQYEGKTSSKHVKFPPQKLHAPLLSTPIDKGYLIGLLVFAFTVVAYTTYGGFWAVTWTDVLEGLVMLAGVILMAYLAIRAVPPIDVQESVPDGKTETMHYEGLAAATEHLRRTDPNLVSGPGPANYLPLGMGFSFFLMWSLMGAGQPSGMVRMMSFKDVSSLRRALMLIAGYYLATYVCLLIIFVCARAILPTEYLREFGTEGEPDSIMPAMARKIAHPLAAGLLLAAPYAAIMSTVAAFLLMISSSLVRDLYQRTINPNVSPRVIKFGSYLVTGLVGVIVTVIALNPPGYLQYIIVFTGTGQGCSFLVPMLLGLYWRRATRAGILAAMLGGFLAVFSLYGLGWIDSRIQAAERQAAATPGPAAVPIWPENTFQQVTGWGEKRPDAFAPLYVGGVDPLVWGMLASLVLGVGVSLSTRPDQEQVKKYFPDE